MHDVQLRVECRKSECIITNLVITVRCTQPPATMIERPRKARGGWKAFCTRTNTRLSSSALLLSSLLVISGWSCFSTSWIVTRAFSPSQEIVRLPTSASKGMGRKDDMTSRIAKESTANRLEESTDVAGPSSMDSLDPSSSRRQFLVLTAAAGTTLLTSPSSAQASSSTTSSTTTATTPLTAKQVFQKASTKALSGGKAGASASILQVLTFMWLRTAMNYQYRYGGTLKSSLSTLYDQGGVKRLYQGLPLALLQGPLTRFGDTAANVGILALLDSYAWSMGLPVSVKTLGGSILAGMWRICLMPVDTTKTVLQVEGREGFQQLFDTVSKEGLGPLYRGALASAGATAVGHYPWFLTYNFLNEALPIINAQEYSPEDANWVLFLTLGRSAVLGLAASCVSDCCSNGLRVIKTTKQTAGWSNTTATAAAGNNTLSTELLEDDVEDPMSKEQNGGGLGSKDAKGKELSYQEALSLIVEKDGWTGLFGRGLRTRLLTNSLQGAVFSVLWRYFQQVQS